MILGSDGEKMSKSRGNVVNPDDIVGEFGGDALRMYEMFMGPLEAVKPWQTAQVRCAAPAGRFECVLLTAAACFLQLLRMRTSMYAACGLLAGAQNPRMF